MDRTEIINKLISIYEYKKYLEIGVKKNVNFDNINIMHKDGVDPAGRCRYIMTSDEFFNSLDHKELYDVIFIDGLHTKEQVLRDIGNSLNHLSNNGTIVVHDCNPIAMEHATNIPDKNIITWNGTVWEAFVEMRMTRNDLFMCVIDSDHGCGIIRVGNQDTIPLQKLTYELLEEKRKYLLNLISVDDFFRRMDENIIPD